MKSYHITEETNTTEIRMMRGSIVFVFDPREIEVAIWSLEHLATILEPNAKKRCGTDEMWAMALQLRKYHEAAGKFCPPYRGLNGT